MSPDMLHLLHIAAWIAGGLIVVAMVLASIRLALGPSRADRVIALDLLTILSIGVVVLAAMIADQPVMMDAAMAVAVIAFLGTIGFARYLKRRSETEPDVARGTGDRGDAVGGQTPEPGGPTS